MVRHKPRHRRLYALYLSRTVRKCRPRRSSRVVVASNSLAVAIRDGFPVTPHYTLVVPRRHVWGWFDLSSLPEFHVTT